jgi:hypothetical protein
MEGVFFPGLTEAWPSADSAPASMSAKRGGTDLPTLSRDVPARYNGEATTRSHSGKPFSGGSPLEASPCMRSAPHGLYKLQPPTTTSTP